MVEAPFRRLGRVYQAPQVAIDAARALAYARATNDSNRRYDSGLVLPPVFGVVPAWPAFLCAVDDLVPSESMPMLLHAGHEMIFHRPLRAGQHVVTTAEVFGVRAARAGAWITLRLDTCGGSGEDRGSVLEQFGTLFVRDLEAGGSGGGSAPAHGVLAASRTTRIPVAEVTMAVDPDQPVRYAEASGDTNPIHLDEIVAKSAGLPGVILHGLCTMAMCAQAVVASVAGDEPGRLRRLGLRFSHPVIPGNDLTINIYRPGDPPNPSALLASGSTGDAFTFEAFSFEAFSFEAFSFEAFSAGHRVVKDGAAEVAAEVA